MTTWLAETDVFTLLTSVKAQAGSQRRARLFACACCRRVWNLLQVEAARRIVEFAEAYADGDLSLEDLHAANNSTYFADFDDRYHGIAEPRLSIRAGDAITAARLLATSPFDAGAATSIAKDTSKDPALDYFRKPEWDGHPAGVPPSATEGAEQVKLLRDVFGNPFRPVAFDPAWRTPTALDLAAQMYESRDFSSMPILADALLDAGCGSEEILSHCLGEGPHVRGCWVVDKVLGKE